jgi:hypothetical protein
MKGNIQGILNQSASWEIEAIGRYTAGIQIIGGILYLSGSDVYQRLYDDSLEICDLNSPQSVFVVDISP